MSDQYSRELLRVAIAQICQTIGYNAAQTTPLELLHDTLHRFLHEFSRDLRRHVEHFNRTEANLNDALLTLNSVNININELLNYVNNVEPVSYTLDVPKFPVHKNSNLNFLKPGSKEVLTRPVHIYEYLPPILPADNNNDAKMATTTIATNAAAIRESTVEVTRTALNAATPCSGLSTAPPTTAANGNKPFEHLTLKTEPNVNIATIKYTTPSSAASSGYMLDDEGRPTRQISSVVMTTGGFISPAIEGKLPDTIIPDIIEKLLGHDAPPPPTPPPPPAPAPTLLTPIVAATAASTVPRTAAQEIVAKRNNAGNTEKFYQNLHAEISANVGKKLKPNNADRCGSTLENICKNFSLNSNNSYDNNASIIKTTANVKKLFSNDLGSTTKTTAAANSTSALKNASHLRTKLQKKSKKNKNLPFPLDATFDMNLNFAVAAAAAGMTVSNEKMHRKRLRMLQKLNKAARITEDKSSKLNDYMKVNSLRKKQVKHKNKVLKQMENAAAHVNILTHVHETTQRQNKKMAAITAANMTNYSSADIDYAAIRQMPSKNELGSFNLTGGNATLDSLLPAAGGGGEPPLQVLPPLKIDDKNLSAAEIKLSNEPDRSKLNIFKKISKQKPLKADSPNVNVNKMLLSPAAAGTSMFPAENSIINLPSGTTITPAPPTNLIARHNYAQDESAVAPNLATENLSSLSGLIATTPAAAKTAAAAPAGVVPSLKDNNFANFSPDKFAIINNNPKKRGRRPGSKNQAKVQPTTSLLTTNAFVAATTTADTTLLSTKKAKKLKAEKYTYPTPEAASLLSSAEPLNLTNASAANVHTANNKDEVYSRSLIMALNALQHEERKKFKSKKNAALPTEKRHTKMKMAVAGAAASIASGSNDSGGATLGIPTKEEVNNINEKLMRIDTVLNPVPPPKNLEAATAFSKLFASTKDMSGKNIPYTNKNLIATTNLTNSKSTATALGGNINKVTQQLQQQHQQQQWNISNTMTPSPIIPLQDNFLSMLPFPFPPRPGLIPTPGIFPPSVPNMFMPRFLPFTNLKSTTTTTKASNIDSDFVELKQQLRERNYCNVAPLVPESMIQMPLAEPKLGQPSTSSLHSEQIHFNKSCKEQKNTISNEPNNEGVSKNFDNIHATNNEIKSKAPGSRNIMNITDINAAATNVFNNIFGQNIINNTAPVTVVPQMSATINTDEPIEVSDDSEADADVVAANNTAAVDKSVKNLCVKKLEDLNNEKVLKKLKKPNKFGKKSIFANAFVPHVANRNSASSLYLFGGTDGMGNTNEKHAEGVGKLAGGADLIPLAGSATGLAYSSKTIPATSLTAAAATTPIFPMPFMQNIGKIVPVTGTTTPSTAAANMQHKIINTAGSSGSNTNTGTISSNIFNQLTITPTVSDMERELLQKKRKEHKKFKKLKEGKIKKKKDKKDKTKKSKERLEKYLHKTDKTLRGDKDLETLKDKELLKKLKKGKRKEKQRLSIDAKDPSIASINMDIFTTPVVFDVNNDLITPSSDTTFAPGIAGTSDSNTTLTNIASSIPKITLKLSGNSETSTLLDDKTIIPKSAAANSSLTQNCSTNERDKRDVSPELVRISPLVTRPPKQKQIISGDVAVTMQYGAPASTAATTSSNMDALNDKTTLSTNIGNSSPNALIPPPSPWLTGGTLAASAVLLPQQLLQSTTKQQEHNLMPTTTTSTSTKMQNTEITTVAASAAASLTSARATEKPNNSPVRLIAETSRPSSYIDAEGNRVWICPACGKVDDGSAMIGCDGCDAWYHWVCVGIFVAPKDNEDWFCRVCITRKKGIPGNGATDKKRKRNKKK